MDDDTSILLESIKAFTHILSHPSTWINPMDLWLILSSSDAVQMCCWLVFLLAIYSFVTSQLTGNCSQTDRLWSITPFIYSWVFAYQSQWNTRNVLMAVLATIWGVRLSYNAYRRGFYSLIPWRGHEDYRWVVVRAHPLLQSRIVYILFDLLFISFFQHILLFSVILPSAMAWLHPATPLNILDVLATCTILVSIVMETIADNEQFGFQSEKHGRVRRGEVLTGDYKRGFNTSGLFSYCRHPNYTCEQGVWWVFYVDTVGIHFNNFNSLFLDNNQNLADFS